MGLGDNLKVLERRLSTWGSGFAAQKLSDLYRRCTEFEPSARLQSVSEISSTLGLVDLRLRRNVQALDLDQFFEEFLFTVVGFAMRDQELGGKYMTRSGRSEIVIWDEAETATRVKNVYQPRARL